MLWQSFFMNIPVCLYVLIETRNRLAALMLCEYFLDEYSVFKLMSSFN